MIFLHPACDDCKLGVFMTMTRSDKVNKLNRTEFMQSYFKEKAEEMMTLIKDAGFECELEESVASDEPQEKRGLFKKKKAAPKRHVAEEKIYHVYVRKNKYDEIVEALKSR